MSLPDELQKLPMRARAVIQFLATHDGPASVEVIRAATGLGERGAGKAIRQLVTGGYIEMPDKGVYILTGRGYQAADDLGPVADAAPETGEEIAEGVAEEVAAESAVEAVPIEDRAAEHAAEEVAPPPVARQPRRLTAVLAQELVIGTPARVMVGLDAPAGDPASLAETARLVLRLSAAGCEIEPPEAVLDVPAAGTAGPVAFRVTPHQTGGVRLRLEARQAVASGDQARVGGLYFDLNVADFPTPQSAEIQALGGMIDLYAG